MSGKLDNRSGQLKITCVEREPRGLRLTFCVEEEGDSRLGMFLTMAITEFYQALPSRREIWFGFFGGDLELELKNACIPLELRKLRGEKLFDRKTNRTSTQGSEDTISGERSVSATGSVKPNEAGVTFGTSQKSSKSEKKQN